MLILERDSVCVAGFWIPANSARVVLPVFFHFFLVYFSTYTLCYTHLASMLHCDFGDTDLGLFQIRAVSVSQDAQ